MTDSPNFTGREKEVQNMDTNDGARVKDCDVLRNFRYSSKFGDLMINFSKVRMLCVKICMASSPREGHVISSSAA